MEEKQVKEETQELKELIESAGREPRDYSGRFMYGERCLAFSTEQGEGQFAAFADMLDETGGDLEKVEVLAKAMRNARVDQLGLGLIIYFPSFEYDEGAEDSEEEEDD
jgi:hypothetical protein